MKFNKNILSRFKNIKKEIEAPAYFRENDEIVQQIEKIVADKLMVDVRWLRQQSQKSPREFSEAIKNFAEEYGWTDDDRRKIIFLLNSTHIFVDYAWARFLFEHVDDEFGKNPDALNYDRAKNKIILQWIVPRRIVSKIAKPIKSIFIPQKEGGVERKIVK